MQEYSVKHGNMFHKMTRHHYKASQTCYSFIYVNAKTEDRPL